VKGTVSGVGHLAEDGYKLATDSYYREQVWNSAVNSTPLVPFSSGPEPSVTSGRANAG
jgi:hypothetical protein